MSSLSEVANQLRVQGDILGQQTNILEQIASSSQGTVKKMGFLEFMIERRKLKDLEAEREANNPGFFKRMTDKFTGDSGSGSGGKGFDFGKFLPAGGLFGAGAALAAALPGFLLKRALPALLAKAFADQIANYVESETGSKELGDAIFRGLQTGSIGLLFGKKIGLAAFIGGALFDESNRAKLKELSDNITDLAAKVDIKLPTMTGILESMKKGIGGSLDFLNSAAEGDLEGMLEDLGPFAATMTTLGLLFKRTRKMIIGATVGISNFLTKTNKALPTSGAPKPALTGQSLRQQVSASLSDKELQKAGLGKTKDGGIVKRGTTKAVSDDTLQKLLNEKAAGRFPKLAGMLRKVPFLGQALSAYDLYSILTGDAPAETKATGVAGIFSGILGSMVGVKLGAFAGSIFGPKGAAIGALAAGAGGYFYGSALGQALAEWALGLPQSQEMFKGLLGEGQPATRFAPSDSGIMDPDSEMNAFGPQREFNSFRDLFPKRNVNPRFSTPQGFTNEAFRFYQRPEPAPAAPGTGVNLVDASSINIGSTQTHYGGVVNSAGIHNFEYT